MHMTQHLLPHTSGWGILGYNEATVQQVALLPDYMHKAWRFLLVWNKATIRETLQGRRDGWWVYCVIQIEGATSCLLVPVYRRHIKCVLAARKRRLKAAWNALTLSSPSSWNIPGELILSFKGPAYMQKTPFPSGCFHLQRTVPPITHSPPPPVG